MTKRYDTSWQVWTYRHQQRSVLSGGIEDKCPQLRCGGRITELRCESSGRVTATTDAQVEMKVHQQFSVDIMMPHLSHTHTYIIISTTSRHNLSLTRSLPGQFFPECHPRVWFSSTEVPAGYVLWCRCTAEIHVLNDEYTCQWHLTWRCTLIDEITRQWQWTC